MAQQIAGDANQLAVYYRLGPVRAVYKPSTTLALIGGLVIIVFGTAWVVVAFGIVSSAASSSSTGFPALLGLIFPLFGVLIGLLGVGILVQAFRNRNLRVYVHEQGLVYVKRNRKEVMRWDQIAFVWHKVKKSTSTSRTTNSSTGLTSTSTSTTIYHSYIVQRADGAKVVFNDTFSRFRELGKTIEQESARYLLPQAIAAFNAGQPLVFGKIYVNVSGVSDGRKTLVWSEVKSIKVDENDGSIAIRKQGKWLNWSNLSLSETPNILVFEAMVNSIIKSRPS